MILCHNSLVRIMLIWIPHFLLFEIEPYFFNLGKIWNRVFYLCFCLIIPVVVVPHKPSRGEVWINSRLITNIRTILAGNRYFVLRWMIRFLEMIEFFHWIDCRLDHPFLRKSLRYGECLSWIIIKSIPLRSAINVPPWFQSSIEKLVVV